MFLFVLLSGYVFRSKGSIWLDIRNKFRQLIIPYLKFFVFFTAACFIRYILLSDMEIGLFLRNTISNLLASPNLDIPALGTGTNVMRYAFVPYWYIAEIFMAFMLFIFINRLIGEKAVWVKAVTALVLFGISGLVMYLDVRGLLANTFASDASYFTVVPNIVGFAALLLTGTILRCFHLFDMDAHSVRFNAVLFSVCLIHLIIRIIFYNNQYGKWGRNGIRSVWITTVTGFTLTYCLIFIAYYLKKIRFIKTCLSFLGARTLDVLLLHFGIGEIWCMILGFWYPVYDTGVYPAEYFSRWHLPLVAVLPAGCIAVYFAVKERRKKVGEKT